MLGLFIHSIASAKTHIENKRVGPFGSEGQNFCVTVWRAVGRSVGGVNSSNCLTAKIRVKGQTLAPGVLVHI